jgi:hypothetical protein
MAFIVNNIRRPIQTERGCSLNNSLAWQYQAYGLKPHLLSEVIESHRTQLIDHAIYLKDVWGVNHRNFWVGACAVAIAGNDVVLLEGANHSPRISYVPDDEAEGITRNCAEMAVFGRAYQIATERDLELGDVALQHLFIAGPHDPKIIQTCTGLAAVAIAPCYDCSPILMDSPHSTPELPITMVSPGWRIEVVESTAREVVSAYEDIIPPLSSHAAIAGTRTFDHAPAFCKV